MCGRKTLVLPTFDTGDTVALQGPGTGLATGVAGLTFTLICRTAQHKTQGLNTSYLNHWDLTAIISGLSYVNLTGEICQCGATNR